MFTKKCYWKEQNINGCSCRGTKYIEEHSHEKQNTYILMNSDFFYFLIGGRSVVCKEVEQHVVVLEEDQKFLKLLELLGLYQELGSIIVFVDKQENADILLKELMRAAYNCLSLHGGIDQFDRDSTIIDFKTGKVKLLIATSVAARGLDVKQLILVVNYDCPNHYEDYVHRCGRTGRAGNKGFAYTFITPEQAKYSGDVIKAFELASVAVPEALRTLWENYKTKLEAEGEIDDVILACNLILEKVFSQLLIKFTYFCLFRCISGKKVHTGGGFSGKGFKFDESEAAAINEKKKFQKAALGLADSDDEDLEHDIDQQIESMFATKRTVKEIKAPLGKYIRSIVLIFFHFVSAESHFENIPSSRAYQSSGDGQHQHSRR